MQFSKQLLSECTSAQDVHSAHPYYLVVGKETIDIWQVEEGNNSLCKHVQLSQFVPYPGYDRDAHDVYQMAPVIDVERGIVVIPQACGPAENRTSFLWVFSLTTGEVLDKAELQGRWRPYSMIYREGKIVATLDQGADEVPPEGQSSLVVCDANKDIRVLGRVHLPNRLQAREAKRIITGGGVLRCIYYTSNGDVVGTSTEAYEDTLDILRWHAGDLSASSQPDADLTIKARFDGCDRTYPSCSTTLDASSFILAVSEEIAGLIPDGYHRQMILYAINWATMSIRWTAEPMWGFVYDVWHVASQGVIVAAGEREMGGWSQFYIAILDASTGQRRSLEVIDKSPQANTPKFWGLSKACEEPHVVVVFTDGTICVVPLAQFVESGFPRDGERVRTERVYSEGMGFKVAVGRKSVLLVPTDGTTTCQTCYVYW